MTQWILVAFLGAWASGGMAWAQTTGERTKPSFPDFDARELPAAQSAAPGSTDATMVERRRNAVESFLASERVQRPGTRIVLNRSGLPKTYLRDGGTLSVPSGGAPEEIARAFLRSHAALFQFTAAEVDDLRLTVSDSAGAATFLAFSQTVSGIDVFEGQVRFTLTKAGEIVQAGVGEVAPGVSVPTTPRLSPEDAVRQAAASIARKSISLERTPATGNRTAFRNPFTSRLSVTTAELNVFPLNAANALLAYRIFLEASPEEWYEILVDAESGALLYRHNLYVAAAAARVWPQSPMQGSRQLVSLPAGWLTATSTLTTGNNADVFVDANGNDQPDSSSDPNLQNGRAYSATQLFDFPFGDGLSQEDPRLFQPAAVTNLFYLLNTAHDYYYGLGFTEAAGNFQTDNLGQGGAANDAVIGEAQFGGFTNNAVFAPTPDGVAPRIRMGLFLRATPALTDDLDSDYDGQTVIHEYGHGVTNRLVGARTSTSCLSGIQSGALGEGWSDYFAISFFNNPVFGAYESQNLQTGIRRQSYAGYTFTYEDMGNGANSYEVHYDGEIWAATLWDLRKSLGQAVTDQLVLNGLKSTSCHPSMTNARDAILSADQAGNGGANRAAIWQVFARHGLGYSSLGVDGSVVSGTRYDAASDLPTDLQTTRNPAVTSNPLLVVGSLGSPYAYSVTASNPNGGTLLFTLDAGPDGMTVNPATGAAQWTAGFTTGSRVKIIITDGRGGRVVHGYSLPVLTTLTTDTPVLISGGADTSGLAFVTVPAGVPVLQFTLRNGTGDADLAVADPHGQFQVSAQDGDNETLSFANPAPGLWLIDVGGFRAYGGVSLAARLVTPSVVSPNGTVSGLSGVVSSETLYRISIPAGATQLAVSTSGGTGDADLFLKKGSPALCQESDQVSTPCDFDQFSVNDGNGESIVVPNPAAGDWYLDLVGYGDYAGLTLTTATTVPPALVVGATALTFDAVQGGPAPSTQIILISNSAGTPYTWTAVASGGSWLQVSPASGKADAILQVSVNPAGMPAGSYSETIAIAAAGLANAPQNISVTLTVTAPQSGALGSGGLYFFPVAPCHLVDTTGAGSFTGEFGPPAVGSRQERTFHPAAGACPGIPGSAKAYSLNVTASPTQRGGLLGYLTIWPAGEEQPLVSTLNGPKGGRVSNAVMVPAGVGGGVSAFVTDSSDLTIDINGYFDTALSANATAFYGLAPCRVADTRSPNGALGGPQLAAGASREFPVGSSTCLPAGAGAKAFSLNVTAIPAEPLQSIAIWPGSSAQPPLVSTVSAPFADVTANAAVVPAGGSTGSINLFASNRTDVALDMNGYFAPAGAGGGLLFHPVTPCRVVDTRGSAGPFGGPILAGGTSRDFAVPSSSCNIPSGVQAYSLNVTVVPAKSLGYLTIWPAGQPQPFVSTLNSWDGRVTANAAIVPAGQNGAVSLYVTNDAHVVVDLDGYFTSQ